MMISPIKPTVPVNDSFEPNSDFCALTCLVSEHSFTNLCTSYHSFSRYIPVPCNDYAETLNQMLNRNNRFDLSFLKTVENENHLVRWALFTDSFIKGSKDSSCVKHFDKIWKYDPYLGVDLLSFAVNTQSTYDWISNMLDWIDKNAKESYMHSEYVLVLRTLVQALLNKDDSLDIDKLIPSLAKLNEDIKASIFNYAACDCMPDLQPIPQQPPKPVCKISNQKKCFPRFFQSQQPVAAAVALAAGGRKKTKKTKVKLS